MLNESTTAIVARNVVWTGAAATDPYEAGWAREAVVFVRAMKPPKGTMPQARLQISPDGMRWVDEGTTFPLPTEQDAVTFARLSHFGNWLRIAADVRTGEITVLVTFHLKG